MIWQQWKIEQNPIANSTIVNAQENIAAQDLPDEGYSSQNKSLENNQEQRKSKTSDIKDEHVFISNTDLKITIGTIGGTIKRSELLNYFETTEENSKNINLFDYENDYYVAQSGLLHDKNSANTKVNKLAPNHHDVYTVKSKDNNSVELEWVNKKENIRVLKKISLDETGYKINIENTIINNSNKAWSGRQYRQIRRKSSGEGRSWITPTFTGGAYYDGTYNKISYDDIAETKPKFNVIGGWVAMMEHYFVSSWFFSKDENNLFYTKEISVDDARKDYLIGARSEAVLIQPNENAKLTSTLYVGPKLQIELENIADGLELTIDYGVLTLIAKPLFWLLDKIHSIVGNWGWSIILLTMLIKLAFYKLSETSYKSMAKMKKFSPKIQTIRERYGSDRQKMNQAMMDMYRKEKINPLGGCWPILVQIPVFIALYWVLLESVELRQADFIFWLTDLSAKDPYFVLPLIMGASMFFQQKLNPAPPDPMQAKVMQMLPIIFTAFFAFFPSGLVLYWVVNNLLSIAQQWKITKSITST
jgi:YidC/Oxa1 family membrane protein insertase